ncbi:hypothetical protein G6F40_017403 [Rhizopus arrhizus]|nr:hypothetical protein G6F31_021198 [Rhizopus arrhizus]KAG1075363.1 hypothetical protein G6F40_017403 [Rhizopus arrhizus]
MALAIEAARNDGEVASAPVVHTPSGNPFARGSPLGVPGNGEDPMDLDSIRQVLNAISTALNGKGRKGFERSNNGRRQIRCYGCQGWKFKNSRVRFFSSAPYYKLYQACQAL